MDNKGGLNKFGAHFPVKQSYTPGKIKRFSDNDGQFQCSKCFTQLFKVLDIQEHSPSVNVTPTLVAPTNSDQIYSKYSSLMRQGTGTNRPNLQNQLLIPGSYFGNCSEYFIGKKDWILLSEGHFGNIYCPKRSCHQKIGVYSTLGLKCICGKQITPGFLVYKNKVNKQP